MKLKRRIGGLPGVAAVRSALNMAPPARPKPGDYHKAILPQDKGGDLIHELLEAERPTLVARIGGFELDCVLHYLKNRCTSRPRPYPEGQRFTMGNNTVFFPTSDGSLDAFAREYLAAISQADVMAVWFNIGEDRVIRQFCPSAQLIPLRAVEPYYSQKPWSAGLRDRRVLVIHPCAESIREQYEKSREVLFDDSDVLPPFELELIKAVQSQAGEVPPFATWFQALAAMKMSMDEVDYDVCIVGAGAYGLPLAAHAKRAGKFAVHMGGATQILFGIKGQRWDEHEIISKLYRDSWVRPKASETPRNATAVEGGCYW